MSSVPSRRKVLFLNDKAAIRNLFYLLKRVDGESSRPTSGESPLASLAEAQFDTVVLDLRCWNRTIRGEVCGLGEVCIGRAGKLLVIVAEVNGPKSMGLFEQYVFNGLPEALFWLVSHRYRPRRS